MRKFKYIISLFTSLGYNDTKRNTEGWLAKPKLRKDVLVPRQELAVCPLWVQATPLSPSTQETQVSVGCLQGGLTEGPPAGSWVALVPGRRLDIPLWRLWRPGEGNRAVTSSARGKRIQKACSKTYLLSSSDKHKMSFPCSWASSFSEKESNIKAFSFLSISETEVVLTRRKPRTYLW